MKRLLALLLACMMIWTVCAGIAEETEETEIEIPFGEAETDELAGDDGWLDDDDDWTDDEDEERSPRDYGVFNVGNPTPMDGKFFTEMWGNSTTDIDVRSLVNAYHLTVWGYDTGIFRKNNVVVSGINIYDDEEGDRTYQMVLYTDLYYSDGTKITAWDYAFTVLFLADPVIAELDGNPTDLRYLKGYEEYVSGEVPYFSGVRVLNDTMIQFTVKQEYLPYFFELHRLSFLPYPIKEIAPGCKVYDDGEGVYIGNEDPSVPERIFTKELLEATVMDPDTGYLSHPTVGSGPYVLTSWDGEVAEFEINPYFKGDEEGYLPTIPKIRFTLAENLYIENPIEETDPDLQEEPDMVDKLEADEFQLLNKVTRADMIIKGTGLVNSGKGYSMSNYPRIGLTFFYFSPLRPAMQENNVRKAFAWCLDKKAMVDDYTKGYGLAMDGFMGIGQWMYTLVNGTMDYPEEEPAENASAAEIAEYEEKIEKWKELSFDGLKRYELNVEEAVRLLEENGWTLNENGEPYDPARDAFRCKRIDGELVKLDLTCAYPETNYSALSMETYLIPHLQEAGIRLTLIPLEMKTLLHSQNFAEIEDIDMYYIGDDFNIEFDPTLFFREGDPEAPYEDTLAWVHAQMYEYCRLMCETEPHDTYGFVVKWLEMQEHLTDYLPLLPVYSNVYFDFYTIDLQNYDILYHITWGDAIVPAAYYDTSEFMPDEDDEDEMELTDDEEIFDDF